MASTRGPRRLPVRGEFKSGDNSTGSQFASVIPGKLLHPKKNLLLVEVSPNHINKSFKLPILITYAFRNALLMDGNSCRSHSGPHAHGPGPRRRASLLPRTAPSGRSTRPGLRGLQGGGASGEPAMSSHVGAPDRPTAGLGVARGCGEPGSPGFPQARCRRRSCSAEGREPLTTLILRALTTGSGRSCWAFARSGGFGGPCRAGLMSPTFPERVCRLLRVTETLRS